MATFEKCAQSCAASVPATVRSASSMSLFGTAGNPNAWGWDGLHRIQFKASFTKKGRMTDKWKTYEADTHRPYGNSWEENALTLKATRYRHSPTGTVLCCGRSPAQGKFCASWNWVHIRPTKHVHTMESSLNPNFYTMEPDRPQRGRTTACYRPAVFFFSFVSPRFYSHREKCYVLFKNHIISLFDFSEIPSIWNCITWNCVSLGGSVCTDTICTICTIRSTQQVRKSWLQGVTHTRDHSLSRTPNIIHRTSTIATTPVRQYSAKNISGHEWALLNMNFKSVLRWRRQWRRSQLA